jgi:hypothetical protein
LTWTIIGVLGTVTLGALTMQAFWISRMFDQVNARLDRIERQLDRIESTVLRDHAERIARIEERLER